MYCPFCGLKNTDGAARCGQCGGEIPVPGRRQRDRWAYRPGPGLGCMIGLAAFGFLSLAIVVPQYVLYQRHLTLARENLVRANMRSLRVALDQCAAEFGQYPVSLEPSGASDDGPGLREVRMTLSRLQNPIDPARPPVVVSRDVPPDWSAIRPGQVVYVPRDTVNGGARGYLIYGMGKKRPLGDSLYGGFE
jgi:hypothetical protein